VRARVDSKRCNVVYVRGCGGGGKRMEGGEWRGGGVNEKTCRYVHSQRFLVPNTAVSGVSFVGRKLSRSYRSHARRLLWVAACAERGGVRGRPLR
jgi:hypothetical protein